MGHPAAIRGENQQRKSVGVILEELYSKRTFVFNLLAIIDNTLVMITPRAIDKSLTLEVRK